MSHSYTNDLTQRIINGLFSSCGIFAYRQNVVAVPVVRDNQVVGFRPPPTAGIPDIQVIVPRQVSSMFPAGSGYLGVEVKSSLSRDRLRPSQLAFHRNARSGGDALIIIVKDYTDFILQVIPIFDLLNQQKIKDLAIYDSP